MPPTNDPIFSVLLPFHAESVDDFKYAVRSVFAQTLTDWELLLLGDHPSPALLHLAHSISDARVSVLSDGTQQGLAARLNQGIAAARGNFTARIDADDGMYPRRLEIQAKQLFTYDFDIIGSRAVVIDEEGTLRGLLKEAPLPRSAKSLLKRHIFTHPTVAAATTWFQSNLFNPSFQRAEDFELWSRALRASRPYKDPQPLIFYRMNRALSLRKSARAAYWNLKVIARATDVGLTPLSKVQLSVRECARVFVLALALALRMHRWVYANRVDHLEPEVSRLALEADALIRATAVPGWAEPPLDPKQ